VLTSDIRIQDAIRSDLVALEARDPACLGFAHGMLNFKGYLALPDAPGGAIGCGRRGGSAWRWRWPTESRRCSTSSPPGPRLGKGLLLDHATGVAVGETASVGDNVSILHHVTLGGVWAARGPQASAGGVGCVPLGLGAKLLGPIDCGCTGAKIGAGAGWFCRTCLRTPPSLATLGESALEGHGQP